MYINLSSIVVSLRILVQFRTYTRPITIINKSIPVIKILSTQMGITAGGLNLEDTILNGKDGHIKGTASKVVDKDVLLSGNLFGQGQVCFFHNNSY